MSIASGIALCVALVCAVTDVRHRKVYNVVTFPAIGAGLLYHGVFGGATGALDSLAGVLFGLGILILPFLLGGTGAGDSKLLAALGAWLQLKAIVYVFIIAGLGCAAASFLLIVFRNVHLLRHPGLAFASLRFGLVPWSASSDRQPELPPAVKKSIAMPFGLLVAVGVGIVLLCGLAEY